MGEKTSNEMSTVIEHTAHVKFITAKKMCNGPVMDQRWDQWALWMDKIENSVVSQYC